MAQFIDVTQYFTRRQSDARYVRLPTLPDFPTLSLLGTNVSGLTSNLIFDVIPPSLALSQIITTYQFKLLDPSNNITVLPETAGSTITLSGLLVNTTYTIQVQSIDQYGQTGLYSHPQNFTTATQTIPPNAPILSGSKSSIGAVLSVNPFNIESDFSHYELLRATDSTMITGLTDVISFTSSTFNDRVIPSSTNYYYQVRATDIYGNFSLSNVVGPIGLTATVYPTSPAMPNLSSGSISPNSDGSISLTWTGNTETTLTNYRLWRKKSTEVNWAYYTTIPATPNVLGSYTDTNLVSSFTYNYSVSALNLYGQESSFSTSVILTSTSVDTRIPSPPTSLSFIANQGTLQVNWVPSVSPLVTLYEVSYRLLSTDPWFPPTLVGNNSFTIYGLTGLKTVLANEIEVRVRGRQTNNGNFSSFLDPGPVTFIQLANYTPASGIIPTNPLSVAFIENGDGTETLNWTAPSSLNTIGYRILAFNSAVNEWIWITDLLSTSSGLITYTGPFLEPFSIHGTEYIYSIQTLGKFGDISIANLVSNSGFEFGLSGWINAGGSGSINTVLSAPVRSGSNSVRTNYAGRLSQTVPILVGKSYTLSAFVRQDIISGAGNTARVRISWRTTSNTIISEQFSGVTVSTNFINIFTTGVAPSLAVTAVISLEGDSSNPLQTFIWDDSYFEQSSIVNIYGDNKSNTIHVTDTIPLSQSISDLNISTNGIPGGIIISWVTGKTPYFLEAVYRLFKSSTSGGIYSAVNYMVSANTGELINYEDTNLGIDIRATWYYKLEITDRNGNTSSFLVGPVSGISKNFNDMPSGLSLDTIPDGVTYARPLSTSLLNGTVDSSQLLLDSIPDGTTYGKIKSIALITGTVDSTKLALDSIPDGSTYSKIKSTALTSGSVDPSKIGVLAKGSIPASFIPQLSYVSDTSSITWSWTSLKIYRVDGTITSITDGTQVITGLASATSYYFFPYWDENLSSLQWVTTSGIDSAGSPSYATTVNMGIYVQQQSLQSHVPLSTGAMIGATVSSGSGGGIGGGDGGGGTGGLPLAT